MKMISTPFARFVCLSSGTVILGVGDAAAALFGSVYGYRHVFVNNKTMEGTSAAMVFCAEFYAFMYLIIPDLPPEQVAGDDGSENVTVFEMSWVAIFWMLAVVFTVESSTNQIDNLYLPIFTCIFIDAVCFP